MSSTRQHEPYDVSDLCPETVPQLRYAWAHNLELSCSDEATWQAFTNKTGLSMVAHTHPDHEYITNAFIEWYNEALWLPYRTPASYH
jgi:hypothetical protein